MNDTVRKTFVAVLTMAAASAVHCAAVWYDTPVSVKAGVYAVDTLGTVDRATIHVRIAAKSHGSPKWGIMWNFIDFDNYTMASLQLPGDGRLDGVYSSEAVVEVARCVDGELVPVLSRKLTGVTDDTGGMNSLKLVYDGGRATLYTGSTNQTEVGAVPFNSAGGVTTFFCDSPVKVQRADVHGYASEPPRYAKFINLDHLADHIKESTDPVEGFWEYLDRSNDPDKAVMGGRYVLATVKKGDAYDIIYIKGAEVASGTWKTLQIKGKLRPTIFRNNYDMEWITTDMHRLWKDVDAQLSDDHSILTLRFPEVGAQLRLRRLLM